MGNLARWLTICAKFAWTHRGGVTLASSNQSGPYAIAKLPIVDAIRLTNEGDWRENHRKRKASRRKRGRVGGGYRLRRE